MPTLNEESRIEYALIGSMGMKNRDALLKGYEWMEDENEDEDEDSDGLQYRSQNGFADCGETAREPRNDALSVVNGKRYTEVGCSDRYDDRSLVCTNPDHGSEVDSASDHSTIPKVELRRFI